MCCTPSTATRQAASAAARARAQGLPTLVLYRDGKAVDRIEGLVDASKLRQRLRFYLNGLESKFGRR